MTPTWWWQPTGPRATGASSTSRTAASGGYGGHASRRLPPGIQNVARRKHGMLNNSAQPRDLTVPPASRLEPLRGDRRGQHSLRINDRWRVCFRWVDGNCHDVEIVDYHG